MNTKKKRNMKKQIIINIVGAMLKLLLTTKNISTYTTWIS